MFRHRNVRGISRSRYAARRNVRREQFNDFDSRNINNGFEIDVTLECEVTKLELVQFNPDEFPEYGELRVHFTGYDQNKYFTLYPQDEWLSFFRDEVLVGQGFSRTAVKDVNWSESGMQGQYYVSFDVGKRFLAEWDRLQRT